MSDLSPWYVAGAILTALGGGGVIVAALLKWLGDVIAKRILQQEQSSLNEGLEQLKQELGIIRTSYDKHVQHVVEYYAMFYRFYQLAQNTEHSDLIRHPDRADLDTKKHYLAKLDEVTAEWNDKQGMLRLLLPKTALDLHIQTIAEFNAFNRAVETFDHNSQESRNALHEAFAKIDATKQQLERCLRHYLRVDKV